MSKSPITAPVAKQIPHTVEIHGSRLVDNYFWLREKENPEVIAHLQKENAYTDEQLKNEAKLREQIFRELKGRLQDDDENVPYRKGEYFYYSRMVANEQYAVFCRKHLSLTAPEEVLLDCNQLAAGQKFFDLGVFEVSPRHDWLAYSVDFDGSEKHSIYFKHLASGKLSPEMIPGAAESLEWSEDNRTVFYTVLDEHERPDRLFRHEVGTDPAKDALLYKETDAQLFVYCSKSKSDQYLFLDIQGKATSEIHYLSAHTPLADFQVIEPRRRGVLYSLSHHENRFFILVNDTVQNFRLVEAPVTSPGAANWKELRAGTADRFLEDMEAFRNYLVIGERENGLPQLRVIGLGPEGGEHVIEFPEPAYNVGTHSNFEFDSEILRFTYTSLVTPGTVFDYNMRERTREVKKTQIIPSGYDSKLYRSERVYATSNDGTKVPISIVYRIDKFRNDGSNPLYLYGYGSYGISIDASFGTSRLSLIDRGFIFAIAHIRGGSEMGRHWYEDAKFLKKKNTFDDFIAAAEYLIEKRYTMRQGIVISGGSAGGMLVGTVINMRPELFRAAVAKVPFVDVINTMLDETLPLTVTEFEEWGNPKNPEYFKYMKEYSPYDNVVRQAYPSLLVTSGLNDPRVTYWEPAKWVAKLRELKTDSNLLLQHINMDAGHGGASGRYEALKETALEFAFILKVFGTTSALP